MHKNTNYFSGITDDDRRYSADDDIEEGEDGDIEPTEKMREELERLNNDIEGLDPSSVALKACHLARRGTFERKLGDLK